MPGRLDPRLGAGRGEAAWVGSGPARRKPWTPKWRTCGACCDAALGRRGRLVHDGGPHRQSLWFLTGGDFIRAAVVVAGGYFFLWLRGRSGPWPRTRAGLRPEAGQLDRRDHQARQWGGRHPGPRVRCSCCGNLHGYSNVVTFADRCGIAAGRAGAAPADRPSGRARDRRRADRLVGQGGRSSWTIRRPRIGCANGLATRAIRYPPS